MGCVERKKLVMSGNSPDKLHGRGTVQGPDTHSRPVDEAERHKEHDVRMALRKVEEALDGGGSDGHHIKESPERAKGSRKNPEYFEQNIDKEVRKSSRSTSSNIAASDNFALVDTSGAAVAGLVAGGGMSLIGLLDSVLVGSGQTKKTVDLRKDKVDEATVNALKQALKERVQLHNAKGQSLPIDEKGAKALIDSFQALAEGKHPDAKETKLISRGVIAQVFYGLLPQKDPVYKSIVSGFIQLRLSTSAKPVAEDKLFGSFKADVKKFAYPLLNYDPKKQSSEDGFDPSQVKVRDNLQRWYTTTQVYIHSGMATGEQLSYLKGLSAVLTGRLANLKGYADISHAQTNTFSKTLGLGNSTVQPSVLPVDFDASEGGSGGSDGKREHGQN